MLVTAATKEAYASAPGLLRPMGTVVVRIRCLQDPAINSNLSQGCWASERSKRSRRRASDHDGIEEVEHCWVSKTRTPPFFLRLTTCPHNAVAGCELTEDRSVVGSLKDVEEALDFTARDLVHVCIKFLLCTFTTDNKQPILTKGKLTDLDDFMDRVSFSQARYIQLILMTITDEQRTTSWSSCFAGGGMMIMSPRR